MMRIQDFVIVGIFLTILVPEVLSSAGNIWTYRGSLGPDHWHLDYPHCGGIKQSPISIDTSSVVVDIERLTPIVFSGYDIIGNVNMTLANNGHTVQVDMNSETNTISGGGLQGSFIAKQFHFHWGAVDSRGSEHDINGHHFPMELHIVHYNKKYGSFEDAVDKEDGLAVLAFFFTVGRFNSHFHQIIEHFREIKFKDPSEGTAVNIHSIPLVEFIPSKLSTFYRYEGSLTTPPCYESVTWTIFNETIEIAEEQLEKFRSTIFENDESDGGVSMDISDDFRPVQCMFHRRVYSSHEDLKYSFMSSGYRTDGSTDTGSFNTVSSFALLLCLISAVIDL